MAVESISPPQSGGVIWRLPHLTLLLVTVVASLSLWLFWDGISYMWNIWLITPEYSHALLIPFIAAFLIWQQKDRLERIPFAGSAWGIAVLLFGGTLLALGQLATIYILVQYAFLVTVYGLVLSFLGPRAFRLILVPLFLLILMIPLPPFVTNDLSLKLQLLSSQLGVSFMSLFGMSVYLQGNVIDLGSYRLEVADACSGLRYLFPLMTLGFLIGYFYKGAFWKRATLFLSSIPLTVLMNSLRVAIIGITVDRWGIGMAEGFLHEFQGWMMFMICTALLFAEMLLLSRFGTESGTWRQLFGVEFPAESPEHALVRKRGVPPTFVVASLVLGVFLALSLISPRPAEAIPPRTGLTEFPLEVGSWHGQTQAMEETYFDALKLDDYILADYAQRRGQNLNFYVAWYNSQRKGEAIHSPRSCLPGGGWQMQDFGQYSVPGVIVSGHPLRVNRTLIQLGDQRQLVYYWFQQRGRVLTNEFIVKWYIFWDALTRHRTDGALVRLIVTIPTNGNEAEADRELTDFASLIAPQLPRFIPN
jgi:exosortase D (VPLPA-CTERM-specific)